MAFPPSGPPAPTVTPPMQDMGAPGGMLPTEPPMDDQGPVDSGAGINEAVQELLDAGMTVTKNPDGSLTIAGAIPPDVPTSDAAATSPGAGAGAMLG